MTFVFLQFKTCSFAVKQPSPPSLFVNIPILQSIKCYFIFQTFKLNPFWFVSTFSPFGANDVFFQGTSLYFCNTQTQKVSAMPLYLHLNDPLRWGSNAPQLVNNPRGELNSNLRPPIGLQQGQGQGQGLHAKLISYWQDRESAPRARPPPYRVSRPTRPRFESVF